MLSAKMESETESDHDTSAPKAPSPAKKPTKDKLKKKDKQKKKDKNGVIYLSRVPQYMNVKQLLETLSQFGETGNIFLQPDDKAPFSKKGRLFTEGWVEFVEKSEAKQVARMLNNTQVGGRRKNPWYADIWNIKYLPKFKWSHLGEQRAYERAVHEQRLRTEISQVKREVSFHTQSFEKSRKQSDMDDRKRKRGEAVPETKSYKFKVRDTEEEILAKKQRLGDGVKGDGVPGKQKKRQMREKKSTYRPDGEHVVGALSLAANKSLLQKLFSGGGDATS